MAKEFTTTSYPMLGLLAVKPCSAYELAQQMPRALGLLRPRARTVYTITAKGRRARGVGSDAGFGAGPGVRVARQGVLCRARHRQTEWASDVVAAWPDDMQEAEPDWVALEQMAQRADQTFARLAGQERARQTVRTAETYPALSCPTRLRSHCVRNRDGPAHDSPAQYATTSALVVSVASRARVLSSTASA